MSIPVHRVGAALLWLALTGCAGVPLDAGRDGTLALLRERAGPATTAAVASGLRDAPLRTQVEAWLAAPLTLDAAVRIALLRNPRLQAQYATLGLSAADVFDAGRLQNPALRAAWLFPQEGASGRKFSAGASLGLGELLLRPAMRRGAAAGFEQRQAEVADAVLGLVADTQRAWIDAVAAAQRLQVRQSIHEAADLAAELAGRHAAAGNLDDLGLQVQRAAASEARLAMQRAQAAFVDARASLQALLGLDAEAHWTLPAALPALDADAKLELAALREQARRERLDLLAARRQVAAVQAQLAAARGARWLVRGEVGAELEQEADGSRRAGPAVSLELPVFQQGQGRVARAVAELQRARAGERQIELAIDAELQRQLLQLGVAREAVEGYQARLIPQREAIVARLQAQANFMLADTFGLLLAKQQEYAAREGQVDAVQDYWRARTALLRAAGTQLVAALPAMQVQTEEGP